MMSSVLCVKMNTNEKKGKKTTQSTWGLDTPPSPAWQVGRSEAEALFTSQVTRSQASSVGDTWEIIWRQLVPFRKRTKTMGNMNFFILIHHWCKLGVHRDPVKNEFNFLSSSPNAHNLGFGEGLSADLCIYQTCQGDFLSQLSIFFPQLIMRNEWLHPQPQNNGSAQHRRYWSCPKICSASLSLAHVAAWRRRLST